MSPGNPDYCPSCSVVICTRDRPAALERCLRALKEVRYPHFEVVVVDNAPSDAGTRELAQQYGAKYVLARVPGLSHARNLAARACETEVLVYLDDDAVPEAGWLGALASEFQDPKVMAVVGRCVPMNVETEAERLWVKVYGPGFGVKDRLVLDRTVPDWFEYANFGGVGTGGNMALRRTAFKIWPGFDERLGRGMPLDGGEENHAFFSLVHRGYKIVGTPVAVVRHPCPQTLDALRSRKLKDRAASVGYLFALMVEGRGYRLRTLRYVFRKLRGHGLPWNQGQLSPALVPRWRLFLAQLRGPWLYLLSSLKVARRSTVPLEEPVAGGLLR